MASNEGRVVSAFANASTVLPLRLAKLFRILTGIYGWRWLGGLALATRPSPLATQVALRATFCMRNEFYGQAERAISTGKLNALLRFHIRPINLVVFQGPLVQTSWTGNPYLGVGFPLRCFQRLSFPNLATRRCP